MLVSNRTIKDPGSFPQQENTGREYNQKPLGKTTKSYRGRTEADLS